MVDSMDELKSSRSVAGKKSPNFGMLDAKIASASTKCKTPTSRRRSASRNRKPKKRTRFYENYFRVTGAHDTVLDFADFFSFTHHGDNIQEFDTRWDEVLLSMSKIPSDDV